MASESECSVRVCSAPHDSSSSSSSSSSHIAVAGSGLREWPDDPYVWVFLVGDPLAATPACCEDHCYDYDIITGEVGNTGILFGVVQLEYKAVEANDISKELHKDLQGKYKDVKWHIMGPTVQL